MSVNTVSSEKSAADQTVTVHKCDYPGCSFIGKNVKSLAMHTMRCHGKKGNFPDKVNVESDSTSVSSVCCQKTVGQQKVAIYMCDYPGCSYVSNKPKSVSMHKRCHNKMRHSLCSTNVSRNADDLPENLQQVNNEDCTRESEIDFVVDLTVGTNDEQQISTPTAVFSDVEPDDIASVETATPKAKGFVASKKGRYTCDVAFCSAVHTTAKGLAVHKAKSHSEKIYAADIASVSTQSCEQYVGEQQDIVYKCDYLGCKYVANKLESVSMHKTYFHKVKKSMTATCTETAGKPSYFCTFPGCSYCSVSSRGIAIHNARVHSKATACGNLTQKLPNLNRASSTLDTDMESLRSQTVETNDEQKLSTSVLTDVEPDNISLASVETACPKPNEIVATEKTLNMCDVADCGSLHDTARGLAVHKSKRHAKKMKVDETVNLESDSMSVSTLDSLNSGLRKSIRINNKKKTFTAATSESNSDVSHFNQSDVDAIHRHLVSNSDKYVCNVDGCGSVHDTVRGLSIHKRKRHSSAVCKDDAPSIGLAQAEDVNSLKSDSLSDSTIYSSVRRSVRIQNIKNKINVAQSKSNVRKTQTCSVDTTDSLHHRMTTSGRRDYLKSSFSAQITEAEKQFLPRTKMTSQTDPLYDRLKDYHDVLIQSVSNRTTEKLSSEVVDVLLNPTVVDDSDCLLYTSPSPRDRQKSRMPSSA